MRFQHESCRLELLRALGTCIALGLVVEFASRKGKEAMERRLKESRTSVELGIVSFNLDRAALCCEASCEAIFDMVPSRGAMSVVCPGCGGASWIPLSTLVPSLRLPPPRLRAVAGEHIRA
jgi:hypothetical protein